MARITKAPQERRKEILDTALELFLKNGYEKTSVSDIVHKLNVAQGLFYYYFKSKEEVFRAALEQYTDDFAAKLESIILDDSISFIKRIEYVLKTKDQLFHQSEEVLMEGIQHSEQLEMDYRLSIHVAQILVGPVSEALSNANEKGVISIKDTTATATFLVFGIFGLIHGNPEQLHNNQYLDPQDIIFLISKVLGVTPEELAQI